MRTATLSILGMYEYNNGVFDLFTLPDGVNKDEVITNICGELAEMELLYPNYEVLRALIGVWSNSSLYKWDKLYKTMLLEYNPIDNYDRTETRKLNSKGKGTGKDGGQDSLTSGGTNTEKVAGFNSSPSSLVDKNQLTTNGSQTNTYGRTSDTTYEKDDIEEIHARGNIGTMSTQEMVQRERNIADFNLYAIITEDFKQRFCLLVY